MAARSTVKLFYIGTYCVFIQKWTKRRLLVYCDTRQVSTGLENGFQVPSCGRRHPVAVQWNFILLLLEWWIEVKNQRMRNEITNK